MDRDNKIVLVAPLEWGLGHATRCIPVIRELLKKNVTVIICASGAAKKILEAEFPGLTFISIPGISVQYPEKGNMVFAMLSQMLSFFKAIKNENKILDEVISKHKITHIISDNRFGLYSSKVKSAFITHQVRIKSGKNLKFLEPLLYRINRYYIEKFNELWIPDLLHKGLSGSLSESSAIKIPVRHLGLLSRFSHAYSKNEKIYDVIVLLSGPEPQRTLLEKKLLLKLNNSDKIFILIQGLPGEKNNENKNIFSTISDEKLISILHPDTLLISRPGYSTVMDLTILKHKKVLFIPTPGQTEQEYLAEYLFQKYKCPFILQDDNFDFERIPTSGLDINVDDHTLLANAVSSFLIQEGY